MLHDKLTAGAPGMRHSRNCIRGILSRPPALIVLLSAFAAMTPNAIGATVAVCKKGCVYQTVQSAIDASKSGDTVTIAAGTYFENLVIEGKTLTIVGAGEDETVIDGGLSGSTIRLGPPLGAPLASQQFAYLTLYAVTAAHGGNSGILVNGGSLNLQNSALVSNQSVAMYPNSSQFGGGISAISARVTVGASILAHNKSSVGGGAIAASEESHVVVTNSSLSRNTSADGGGIFVDVTSIVSVTGSTLADNTANGVHNPNALNDGGTGGAVYVAGRDVIDHAPGGMLAVSGSSLVDNNSAGDGGGIAGFATLTNSVVARNISGHVGGGIAGGASLTNVFIVENSAAKDGGGVYIDSLQQTGSTIADNTPDNCGSSIAACPAP